MHLNENEKTNELAASVLFSLGQEEVLILSPVTPVHAAGLPIDMRSLHFDPGSHTAFGASLFL